MALPTPRDPSAGGSTTAAAIARFLESRTAATTRAGYTEPSPTSPRSPARTIPSPS
ncbi:hypothetical protein AB0F17_65065 [Nonomuraea sp. NPDC026600]|uniref:hypothetical protein n=1 Tax=Nonomuraea sp. NPDC026600 TaxID=3155363 RepID=UPI0033CE259F